MELEDRRIICKVCLTQFSRYICPRCNITYCSLPCYKAHSGGCTEAFYREQAVGELRGMRAGDDERTRIMQVLQRARAAQEEEDALVRAVMAGDDGDDDQELGTHDGGSSGEGEASEGSGSGTETDTETDTTDGDDDDEEEEEEEEEGAAGGVSGPAAGPMHHPHAASAAQRAVHGLPAGSSTRGRPLSHKKGRASHRRLTAIMRGGGHAGATTDPSAKHGHNSRNSTSVMDNLLSQETLRKLALRAAAAGDDPEKFEVSEADLSPEELKHFLRAVAAGRLSSLLPPWVPWWEGAEAEGVRLGRLEGGRLVVEVVGGVAESAGGGTGGKAAGSSNGDGGGGTAVAPGSSSAPGQAVASKDPAAAGAGTTAETAQPPTTAPSPLPPLPSEPLQPLSALSRVPPSPLLRYVLLELLYTYCFIQRQYNGEAGEAGVVSEAAETALALSPALRGAVARSSVIANKGGPGEKPRGGAEKLGAGAEQPQEAAAGAAAAAAGAAETRSVAAAATATAVTHPETAAATAAQPEAAAAGASACSEAGTGSGPGARAAVAGAPRAAAAAPSAPQSARQALCECVARACAPPVGDAGSRVLAVGAVRDVARVLAAGGGAVVLALSDLQRTLQAAQCAAMSELESESGTQGVVEGGARSGFVAAGRSARAAGATAAVTAGTTAAATAAAAAAKRAAARLDAAARKLWFFMCWAHEALGSSGSSSGSSSSTFGSSTAASPPAHPGESGGLGAAASTNGTGTCTALANTGAGPKPSSSVTPSSKVLLDLQPAEPQAGPALCAELSHRARAEWQAMAAPAAAGSSRPGAQQPGSRLAAAAAGAAGQRRGPLVTPV